MERGEGVIKIGMHCVGMKVLLTPVGGEQMRNQRGGLAGLV